LRVDLTEEQEFFRAAVRKFLEGEVPLTVVRDLYEDPEGFDRGWWRQAAEVGWTSLLVPEELGGGTLSGSPVADAVILAEEIGRLVAPGPFLPVNVVAAALVAAGSEEQRSSVLPGLVAGNEMAAWAFCEPSRRWVTEDIATTADLDGDEVVLDGAKAYVEAAAGAAHLLVTATNPAGLTQVLVPADTPGVQVTSGRSLDMTRRFASVRFAGARLPRSAVIGEVGSAARQVDAQRHLAIALQCAELVGVAERILEVTLEYGRERISFGRPIVSYQALKHRIADMYVRLEGAKAVSDALAVAIDAGDDDVATLAGVTKAYVGAHTLDIVDDCVQITGGIGVTWEHDIHLYNRRAAVSRAVYGTPEEHKQELLRHLANDGDAP
jgi:alkylation response protein AidB-like acyl-CoA dehydrogenase